MPESSRPPRFALAAQVGRVPSLVLPLDAEQQRRFDRLTESLVMIDMHQHPMVLSARMDELIPYFRSRAYAWGYEAVRAGGWTAVTTANVLSALGFASEGSYLEFSDLVTEIGLMLADLARHADQVATVHSVDEILDARQRGQIGFLPTVEHLAMGSELYRIDVLYGMGIRLAGLTYSRKTYVGDGQFERTDCGLSDLGIAAVERMNDLGMIVDLSHAGAQTALEAIAHSRVPVIFSHNASKVVWETSRTRADAEFVACAERGGLVCVTAVPNSLSDAPDQSIESVLDHYDYLVRLLGVEHVGIGTDTQVGDHVGFHKVAMGRDMMGRSFPAPYLDGLESPADGKNIIRGLIRRGYDDDAIRAIAGGNALTLLRRVVG